MGANTSYRNIGIAIIAIHGIIWAILYIVLNIIRSQIIGKYSQALLNMPISTHIPEKSQSFHYPINPQFF